LNEGGFSVNGKTRTLAYWKLTGGNPAGEVIELSNIEEKNLTENIKTNLTNLINVFDDPKTPYYAIPILDNAPAYNDYEYLERVKEWTALDGVDSAQSEAV